MAKFKIPVPEQVEKYGFWISVGVLSLVLTIVWWLGTSAVAEKTQTNLTEIKNVVSTIGGTNPTANDKELAALTAENGARKDVLMQTWKTVYERQKKELVWPLRKLEEGTGKVLEPGLSPEFVDAVTKLPPPERLAPTDDLRPELKEQYRNFAKTQIEDACKIIGALHRVGNRRTGTTRPVAEKAEDAVAAGEIVFWPTASQADAQDLLTFPEGGNPATQDILYAQEDLWVYQTLFKIIRRTNDSLKENNPKAEVAHYNAPVKVIHEILIGRNFEPRDSGDLYRLERKTTMTRAEAAPASDEEGGEPVQIPAIVKPAGERYVDAKGERLKGEKLAELGTTALFKRMPVHMQLEIDQRYLGRLLVECANSPLTVEVKQVYFKNRGHIDRIEKESGPTQAGQAKEEKGANKNFYDLTVDITGHIYIFYPPADDKPAEEATEEEPGEAAAPAQAGG